MKKEAQARALLWATRLCSIGILVGPITTMIWLDKSVVEYDWREILAVLGVIGLFWGGSELSNYLWARTVQGKP